MMASRARDARAVLKTEIEMTDLDIPAFLRIPQEARRESYRLQCTARLRIYRHCERGQKRNFTTLGRKKPVQFSRNAETIMARNFGVPRQIGRSEHAPVWPMWV